VLPRVLSQPKDNRHKHRVGAEFFDNGEDSHDIIKTKPREFPVLGISLIKLQTPFDDCEVL
jgi:hypothetical protein